MKNKLAIFILLALVIGTSPGTVGAASVARYEPAIALAADKFYQTELYFGRSIKGGGSVSDEEWRKFLADEVTPRFPDGFTVVEGYGQYRDKSGKITSEPSSIIIILYPASSKKVSRAKIDEIRAAYIKKFRQESVLRVDIPKAVNVAF